MTAPTRINDYIASQMARALVTRAYKADVLVSMKREREFYMLAYNQHHTPEILTKMAELEAVLGDNNSRFTFKTNQSVSLRSQSGYVERVTLNPTCGHVDNTRIEIVDMPSTLNSFDYRSIGLEGDESAGFEAFITDKAALIEKLKQAYAEAFRTIKEFKTYKKLREGWPEALPIIEGYIPVNDRQAVAVPVSHLNAKFGLPPETATA